MFTILPSSASRLDLYNTGQILYNLIGISAAGVTSVSVTGHSSQSGNLNFSGIGGVTVSTGVGNFIYFSGATTSSSTDHSDGINLSGNLQTTGQTLDNRINSLSGYSTGQFYPNSNPSNYTTSGNLQLTGSNLQTAINLISGNYLTGIHSGNYIPKYVINGSGFDESIIYQSGNKVGIGATGFLSNILTVSSSTSIDGIRINNLNGGGAAQAAISFSYDSNSLTRSRIGYFPATNELRIAGGGDNLGFVTFYAGGAGDVTTATEKMRIQPGGSVGINTSAPLSNSKLDVSGNIYGSGINASSLLTISGQSVITGGPFYTKNNESGFLTTGEFYRPAQLYSGFNPINIDWNSGNCFKFMLTGNVSFNHINNRDGQTIVVGVSNTGGKNFSGIWPSNIHWPSDIIPSQTSGSKMDVYTFITLFTGIYGNVVQGFSN